MEIMNIIVRTPNFIGDSIMMLPALELLKLEYPDAKFTIVCKASSKDIFRDKGIDTIIIDDTKSEKRGRLSRVKKLISTLREKEYDLGILFHNTFLDALIFKLSHIRTIVGYDNESRKILLDFHLKIDRSRHYVNHYANLVNQYLDNKYRSLPAMHLHSEASKLIETNTTRPTVGFVLGANTKDTRFYPKDLSLALFNLLKTEELNIVLLGDKDDSEYNVVYESYLMEQESTCQNLSGKTNVSEFIDAIATVDVLVTIDTSALHIAAAVETNFILLQGKGTSAFSLVQPKVSFGEYIFEGGNMIQDKDAIAAIEPVVIKDRIIKMLKSPS
ncbi:MAG: hypothetical protein GQ531_06730, partial [Sulfurovum sp.]|nr:hypothetical protein [Sulfurovum sp.]